MSKKQTWSKWIAMSCKDELDITKGESIEKVEYGIAILTLNLAKTVLLLLLTLCLGITQYTLVYILAIVSIRFFSFGIHLKNSWGCLLWGLADYIGGVYIALYISLNLPIRFIIFAVCFLLLGLYAPAGTRARPIGALQYKPLKENTLVVLCLLFGISWFLLKLGYTAYSNIIMVSMISQTISVLPITFYIFNIERGKINV